MYNRGYQNQNAMMYQNAKSPVRQNNSGYANANQRNNFQYLSPQARQGGMQSQKQMMYSPQQNMTQRDRHKENQPPMQRPEMQSPYQNGAARNQGQYRSPQTGQNRQRNMAPNLSSHDLSGNQNNCNPFQKYQQAMKSPGSSKMQQNYYQNPQQNAQVMNVRTQGRPQGGFGLNKKQENQYMMQSPKVNGSQSQNQNQNQGNPMYSPSQQQMKSPGGYMTNTQRFQSPSQREDRMRSPYQNPNNGQRYCSPQPNQMNRQQMMSPTQSQNQNAYKMQNSQEMYSPSAANKYSAYNGQQSNVQQGKGGYPGMEGNKMNKKGNAYNYYSPQMNAGSKFQNPGNSQHMTATANGKGKDANNPYILTVDKPTIHPAKSREFLATKGKIDEMLQTAIQRSKELTKQIEETKAKVKNKEQEIATKSSTKTSEGTNNVQTGNVAKEEESTPVIPYKKYNGEMVDKKRHGKGTCIYHTGEVYEGEWKIDRRDGFGSLKTSEEKQIYFGDWETDVFHGKGVFYNVNAKCADGEVDIKNIGKLMRYLVSYDGEFAVGKFEGKGHISFSNGDKFKGVFSQGIAHGEGVYVTSKGMETKGRWINNKLVQNS